VKRVIASKKAFSHKPDIGVNKLVVVEPSRKAFFKRLYEHEDPAIGRRRARSANPSSSSSSARGEEQRTSHQSRSRSVSRKFTGDRRREFERVQLAIAQQESGRAKSKAPDIDKRPPWGHYCGNIKRPEDEQSSETPAKRKVPVFYNYVFTDPNDTVASISPGVGGSVTESPSDRIASDITRDQQLQILSEQYLSDAIGRQSTRKLTEGDEQILVAR